MTTATVRAAQSGDLAAFARLVDAHAGLAAAVALARTGRPETAEEVAQEAFLDAWRLLPTLREPAAFGAWLRRIVIKQADRVTRRRHRDRLLRGADLPEPPSGDDPERNAGAAEERRGLLRALAGLAPHQREVCALFYLSGRSHAEIAALLGVTVPAVKKRLHDARRRLAPQLEDAMTWTFSALPLRVRAFVAARSGRVDVLNEALDADPTLIRERATADPESLATRYVPAAAQQSLLWEAISYGHREVIAELLRRGADPDESRGLGTTALLHAVEQDRPEIVSLLLEHGADPTSAMWHGGTGLHVAARRRRRELEALLLAGGCDPTVRDVFGRTAADWWALREGPDRPAPHGRVVDASGRALDGGSALTIPTRVPAAPDRRVRETGIKALDLLAPMVRGGVHRLIAGAGVGKIVLIGELGTRLGPTVVAGMLDRTWDVRDFEPVLRELGVWDGAVVVLGAGEADHTAVARTALGLAEATGGWVVGDDRLLHELRTAGPQVPVVGFGPHVHPDATPDPSDVDAQWVLDPQRARRRDYPALDVAHATSMAEVTTRHAHLADAVQREVASGSPRGERLLAWLTQPFRSAENFNGRPGVVVPLAETLDDAEALLAGAADAEPPDSLRYRATLASEPWPTAGDALF